MPLAGHCFLSYFLSFFVLLFNDFFLLKVRGVRAPERRRSAGPAMKIRHI